MALETAWQTQSWASRVISTILGIVETDAYLLYKKFHPGGSKISHSDFTESVAKGLLIRRIPGASTSNSESLPHDIVPLSSLTYYNKNSPYAAATYANRLCTICKSPCKYLCRVCSDTSKGSIVAMCGLKSKNGCSCITKHNEYPTIIETANIIMSFCQLLRLMTQFKCIHSICSVVIYVNNQPHQWNPFI